MRAELIWTTVIPDLWAIDLTVPGHTSAAPLTSVPASSGARELQMRTGIPWSIAGWVVLGCSTFAPKYASSAASAYDRLGMVRAPGGEAGRRQHRRDERRREALPVGHDLVLQPGAQRRLPADPLDQRGQLAAGALELSQERRARLGIEQPPCDLAVAFEVRVEGAKSALARAPEQGIGHAGDRRHHDPGPRAALRAP